MSRAEEDQSNIDEYRVAVIVASGLLNRFERKMAAEGGLRACPPQDLLLLWHELRHCRAAFYALPKLSSPA